MKHIKTNCQLNWENNGEAKKYLKISLFVLHISLQGTERKEGVGSCLDDFLFFSFQYNILSYKRTTVQDVDIIYPDYKGIFGMVLHDIR